MKGLYRFLSPFAPDQSGAVSVLFELGGIIVVCDAGGCTGNICGFDEPRWFTNKSALFSAGLRDMDAILGRDDRLMNKIGNAVSQIDCNFIALIGTPVPSVIGTDLKALARIAKKRFGLPVLSIETTGMDLYDRGQEKAYLSLFQTFALDSKEILADEKAPEIGIIGATPLDLPSIESASNLRKRLQNLGYGRVVSYGMGSGLEEIGKAGAARCNVVVSPSGIKAAKLLNERFGTPYVIGIPLTESGAKELKTKIDAAIAKKTGNKTAKQDDTFKSNDGGILIIHQQILANTLREELRAAGCTGKIDVASWFMLEKELTEDNDSTLCEEDDLAALLGERQYKVVAGDPMFRRAIQDWHGEYIDLPHYAVSGGLHEGTGWHEAFNRLKSAGLKGEKSIC